MIYDSIENIEMYYCLSEEIKVALMHIKENKSFFNEPKALDLRENIKLTYSHYETVEASTRRWSAHDKEIEIHVIEDGEEKLGFVTRNQMEYIEKHKEKDILYYEGEGNWLKLTKGMVAIVFPNDVHIPKVINQVPCNIKKAVYKIKI